MPNPRDIPGNAALTNVEAMLLTLNDLDIIPEKDIVGILKDAATTHELAPDGDGNAAMHKAVAALINGIIEGRNSVRHPAVPAPAAKIGVRKA